MAGRKITIEFLGKPDKAIASADKVEQRFGKMGGKLDRIGHQAGKVLAGGLLLGGAALVKLGKGAAEDETAARNLANTLKNTAGATKGQVAQTESWITAQGKALGIADDELRPALGRLASVTHDVGKAQKLTSLAMDVSQGTGKSLTTVTEALMKAQNGSVGGLSRLGVQTKDAAGKTLSLDKITKNLADTYKGAASKAANTAEGKQRRLQVSLSEMGETIGYKVLPFMVKLTTAIQNGATWAGKHTTLVKVLGGVFVTLAAGLWAASAAMRAYAVITKAWTALTIVARNVQMAWNLALMANPIGLIVLALVGLGVALVIAYKKSERFRKIVDGAFRAVKDAASTAWNWVKRNWPLLLAIITGPIGLATLYVVRHWKQIKDGAGNAVGWVKDKFGDLVRFVRGLPGRIGNAASGMFGGIKNAFRSALNWIIGRWNNLSFTLPSINTHIPGVGRVGGFTLGTPNIPYLEHGGTLRSAGDVIVADRNGRGGERVSLPKGARVTPLKKDDGTVAEFTINLRAPDGRTIQTELLKLKRHNGGLELGLA